jgi:hypothetical protein
MKAVQVYNSWNIYLRTYLEYLTYLNCGNTGIFQSYSGRINKVNSILQGYFFTLRPVLAEFQYLGS